MNLASLLWSTHPHSHLIRLNKLLDIHIKLKILNDLYERRFLEVMHHVSLECMDSRNPWSMGADKKEPRLFTITCHIEPEKKTNKCFLLCKRSLVVVVGLDHSVSLLTLMNVVSQWEWLRRVHTLIVLVDLTRTHRLTFVILVDIDCSSFSRVT